MNQNIRRLNLEKLLFLDIETVSRNKELKIDSKEFQLFQWKNRDKNTDKPLPNNEVVELYKKKAALSPVFNKIVCITVAYIKDNILYHKSFTGDQKNIIESLYNILNSGEYIPCGHNIIGFDFPTIRLKGFESKIEVELVDKFSDSQKKPWDIAKYFVDTMEVTKGTYFYNLSLDDMCFLAGIESPKDKISGSEVSDVYYNKEDGLDEIVKYCEKDVIAVAKLLCCLSGNPDFIKEVVSKNSIEIKEKKVSLLERIYNSGHLRKKDIDKLVEVVEKEKLNKKDVLTLVEAALSKEKTNYKEEINELKRRLGLLKDYSSIINVVEKGNIGVKECKALIKKYKYSSLKERKQIFNLTTEFLTEEGKISQKNASNQLIILKKELLNE